MGTAAVALAYEALTHAEVLIGFMTTFGEANAGQLIHGLEVLHEGAEGPHSARFEEVAEKVDDFGGEDRRVVYFGVGKKGIGR